MPTQIHAAGPTGQRSPGLDAAIAGYLAENGGGGGVEVVSGTVDLDGTGSPVREFYCTGAATIEGVAFAAGTAVVFRRTPAGVWGYIVVDPWTDISATTTTTTTAATTTTTTTAAAGTLTYQGVSAATVDVSTGGFTYEAPIGAADANRIVIVLLTWWGGADRYPSLTINGGAALTPVYDPGAARSRGGIFYMSTVPTGTTATINASAGSSFQPAIAVWTGTRAASFIAGNWSNLSAPPVANLTLSIPTAVNGGFAIAGQRFNNGANGAVASAWTGITERYDSNTAQPFSGGDMQTTGAASATVTFTPSASVGVTTYMAAFNWA